MAALVGYNGAVKIGANTVAQLNSWELSPSANILDDTSFGDDWKVKVAGLKDWTAKASGQFDFSDTNGQMALWTAFLNGTSVTISFYTDDTGNFSGTALVKGISPKAGVDALVSADFDLEGSGALTKPA